MKIHFEKTVMLIAVAVLLSACGKKEEAAQTAAAPIAAPAATVAANAPAEKPHAAGDLGAIGADGMPELARRSNCSACHAIDKKILGPSWMEVSKKYKGATSYEFAGKKYSLADGLFMKVSKGGAGSWGTMPMPANSPAVKDEDIKALIKFVLGLQK